jgi:hypothetical protein
VINVHLFIACEWSLLRKELCLIRNIRFTTTVGIIKLSINIYLFHKILCFLFHIVEITPLRWLFLPIVAAFHKEVILSLNLIFHLFWFKLIKSELKWMCFSLFIGEVRVGGLVWANRVLMMNQTYLLHFDYELLYLLLITNSK